MVGSVRKAPPAAEPFRNERRERWDTADLRGASVGYVCCRTHPGGRQYGSRSPVLVWGGVLLHPVGTEVTPVEAVEGVVNVPVGLVAVALQPAETRDEFRFRELLHSTRLQVAVRNPQLEQPWELAGFGKGCQPVGPHLLVPAQPELAQSRRIRF